MPVAPMRLWAVEGDRVKTSNITALAAAAMIATATQAPAYPAPEYPDFPEIAVFLVQNGDRVARNQFNFMLTLGF